MQSLRKIAVALLVTVLGVVGSVAAYAMIVQPVVIDLTTAGRGMSDVVTVENTFDKPLPVEMRIEAL